MIKKYLKVSRKENDQFIGGYIRAFTPTEVLGVVESEFDSFDDWNVGDELILKIVEMEESDYKKLPEFIGY